MTTQNIIQEIIDGYLTKVKEKKSEWKGKVPYDEIPKLTITTAFWFMRITGKHYASLNKGCSPEISTKQIEEVVAAIQKEIYNHFSDIFTDDFAHYSLFMIDHAYKSFDAMASEWKNISDEPNINGALAANIDRFMKELANLRQGIPPVEMKYHFRLLKKYKEGILPSFLLQIDSFSEQMRNSPAFYRPSPRNKDAENEDTKNRKESFWRRFRNGIKPLADSVANMQEMIPSLFHLGDDCLKEALSLCNEKGMPYFTEFLYNLRYPASIHFNLESTLLFMFLDTKMQDDKFSWLIRKYETFFNNLYASLRKDHAMIDTILFPMDSIDYEEALEGYVGAPADDQFIEKKLSVLHLKKLIALQKFHDSIAQRPLPPETNDLLNRFDLLLTYTKMPYIAYNPILDNLPQYVMDTLGINQTALCKVLDVNKSTISRQRDNNTLIKKNKWFWIAAAGYTYEYLNGETTIPNYGKPTDNDANKYLIAPAVILAHGELFLKRVNSLKDYRIRLSKTNSKRKTNLLSKKHLQEISKESMIFANHLRKCRDYIDALCERERNEEMTAAVNHEKKTVVLHSKDATEKLLSYFEIFDRMLDAMRDNHIVEVLASLKEKTEPHPLELIEKLMETLSILTLSYLNSIDIQTGEICLTKEFKNCSKLTQKQIIEFNQILIDLTKVK